MLRHADTIIAAITPLLPLTTLMPRYYAYAMMLPLSLITLMMRCAEATPPARFR